MLVGITDERFGTVQRHTFQHDFLTHISNNTTLRVIWKKESCDSSPAPKGGGTLTAKQWMIGDRKTMSEKTRLRFRRIEAELLKAFHRGFSLLLAVFVFTLLAIVLLHLVFGTYAVGLLVIPSVVVIIEALLAALDFLFEFLAGDVTYEQAGIEPPEGTFSKNSEDSSMMDDARMFAAVLKASRKSGKSKKGDEH